MKSRIFKFCIGATLLLGSASITFAGGYQNYTDYILYGRHMNNYTGVHQKDTGDDFIINEVTSLKDTKKATFWAVNGNGDTISNTYNFTKDENKTIKFKWNKGLNKGDDVQMGMENAEFNQNVAVVSGKVDFR